MLSSSLCEPEYFTHCAPEDLDPPARLAKLKAKLEPEMARGAVIGLQEVSQKWAGDLHVFFAQRGYHLVCSLYGKPFNGYMGIALAMPLDKYEVCKVDISRCSDTARLPKEPTPGGGILRKIFVDTPKDLFHKARQRSGLRMRIRTRLSPQEPLILVQYFPFSPKTQPRRRGRGCGGQAIIRSVQTNVKAASASGQGRLVTVAVAVAVTVAF